VVTDMHADDGAVAVVGEALIDLVPAATPGHFVAHPGGSPFNVAVGLARLGRRTALLARLSNSAFGRLLRAQAQAEGIDLSRAVDATQPATLAIVSLDPQARASYDFYLDGTADWQWTAAELAALPAGTHVLHFGSLAAWTPPGDAAIRALAARTKQSGDILVSYDPNVRPALLGEPHAGRAVVEAGVAASHLVKASRDDIAWLYPDQSIDDVARRWLALGALLAVVTDGPAGAHAFAAAGVVHRSGRPVRLVDTVGAGDAFSSGLLDGLVGAGVSGPGALARLTLPTLSAVVDRAVAVSALTCERPGADPPRAGEIADFEARSADR
jgi:fructokinase